MTAPGVKSDEQISWLLIVALRYRNAMAKLPENSRPALGGNAISVRRFGRRRSDQMNSHRRLRKLTKRKCEIQPIRRCDAVWRNSDRRCESSASELSSNHRAELCDRQTTALNTPGMGLL